MLFPKGTSHNHLDCVCSTCCTPHYTPSVWHSPVLSIRVHGYSAGKFLWCHAPPIDLTFVSFEASLSPDFRMKQWLLWQLPIVMQNGFETCYWMCLSTKRHTVFTHVIALRSKLTIKSWSASYTWVATKIWEYQGISLVLFWKGRQSFHNLS